MILCLVCSLAASCGTKDDREQVTFLYYEFDLTDAFDFGLKQGELVNGEITVNYDEKSGLYAIFKEETPQDIVLVKQCADVDAAKEEYDRLFRDGDAFAPIGYLENSAIRINALLLYGNGVLLRQMLEIWKFECPYSTHHVEKENSVSVCEKPKIDTALLQKFCDTKGYRLYVSESSMGPAIQYQIVDPSTGSMYVLYELRDESVTAEQLATTLCEYSDAAEIWGQTITVWNSSQVIVTVGDAFPDWLDEVF